MRSLIAFLVIATVITGPDFESRLAGLRALIEERGFAAASLEGTALLEDAERAFGPGSLEVGRVLDQVVSARLGLRSVDDECLALIERAVRIKESAVGKDHEETAQSLSRNGRVLQALQRPREARPLMERALRIQERRFGKGSPAAADVLSRLAQVYIDLDLEADAARLLAETLAIRDADPDADPAILADLLYNLARLNRTLGDFTAAEGHYRRLLDLTPETGDGRRSYVLNGLGALYVEQARYAQGQEALEEAVRIARSAGLKPEVLAFFLNNLGFALESLADYESAVRVHGEALRIRRTVLGDEHRSTAATLSNLASAHAALGDLENARTLHEEALGIRERVAGPASAAVGTSLHALARLDLDTGRPADAVPRLERVIRIRTDHLGRSHYDTGEARANLARALAATGDLHSAEQQLREAMPVIEDGLGKESPVWGEACVALAMVRARRGAFPEAWDLAREAERRARDHARLTASALSERQALGYAAVRKTALDLVLSLRSAREDPGIAAQAWDHVIRSRALVLDEVAGRRAHLDPVTDPEIARLVDEYSEASAHLARLMVRGPADGDGAVHAKRLLAARQARERTERDLAARSRGFGRDLSRRNAGLDAVLAARPEGAAVVAYVRYERTAFDEDGGASPAYAAFVLSPQSSNPVAIELGHADALDRLVSRWRAEVVLTSAADLPGAVERYRAVGAELRAAIWDPVAAELGDAGLAFVVPDGALHRVNLLALPAGKDRYLVQDDLRIHLLSAERDFSNGFASDEPRQGLLAVGGADFGAAAHPADERSPLPLFDPLPETAPEVEAVAASWSGEATLLVGADATETAFKELAPGRRVVHVATHGFFLDGRRSAASPRRRGIGGLSVRPSPAGSPLKLSGLAFAGANANQGRAEQDDGVLTAEEIAAMDFSGTEWVVLSACDTGLGDIETGEGVVGLRRAFEVSGVKTLVMSLWDVEDESTRRWMAALYRNRFESGESTIESLSGASRSVLDWCRTQRGTDHPFFWGAFVAVGHWE